MRYNNKKYHTEYIEDILMFLLNMSFISQVKWTIFIFHEWRSFATHEIKILSTSRVK